jgi:Tfp pilus assembly protein PilN
MTAPTPTTPTQGLTIAGLAFSQDGVARLLSRLMLIPDLSDVTLASSAAATNSTSAGVQFNISASVKGAPVPVAPAATTATTDTSSTTTTDATS